MEITREQLYDYVSQVADGDYNIGMHGILPSRLPDDVTVDMAAQSIMENGLRNLRPINGTVRFFGRMDLAEDEQKVRRGLEQYNFGGAELMLVATPTRIRNNAGESMFIGSPNLDNKFVKRPYTAGYEETSLHDQIIQDRIVEGETSRGNISPEFILGGCKVIDEEHFDVTFNPDHVCFNGGCVTDSTFERIKERFDDSVSLLQKTVRLFQKEGPLTPDEKKEINGKIQLLQSIDERFDMDSSTMLETLTQLRDDDTKRRRTVVKRDVPLDFCEKGVVTNQK